MFDDEALDNGTQVAKAGRRRFIRAAALVSVAVLGGTIAWGASPAVSARSTTVRNAAASATTQMALPTYFVGAYAGTGNQFGLYREFVRTAMPVGATPAQKARAAVTVAMGSQPFTDTRSYLRPWAGTSVRSVTVTPRLITITLSGPGAKGFTARQTNLAVQELVWTAQAAVGQGTIPVKFALADGSTKLFGTYPTSGTYNRPARDLQYQDLATIWITSPEYKHVFPARTPVVAKGESCAFEANTQWQLMKGRTVIRSGFTTASSGCPTRGTWQVNLGVLAAGDYTFRMYEVSMEDGKSLVADMSKPFTVR
jgi:hypothetical protein